MQAHETYNLSNCEGRKPYNPSNCEGKEPCRLIKLVELKRGESCRHMHMNFIVLHSLKTFAPVTETFESSVYLNK
jgi:hypothetical protein